MELKEFPFLQALAEREEAVRNGKLTVSPHSRCLLTPGCIFLKKCACVQSIIFIRDRNARGQEISGYIDFAHRLKSEVLIVRDAVVMETSCQNDICAQDFGPYFARTKRLLPRPSDLSYYNWETQT